jgi:hypothetical protein
VIGKHRLPSWALTTLLIASGPIGQAQPPSPAVDTASLGPQVGAAVPPISGVDQFGQTQALASLSGPKGLMLVFSRSADW